MTPLWRETAMLAWETYEVMCLRALRMMSGEALAEREGYRMVTEKVLAASQEASQPSAGEQPDKVVRNIRRIVRANKRRLS
jgi:hypothetical protein